MNDSMKGTVTNTDNRDLTSTILTVQAQNDKGETITIEVEVNLVALVINAVENMSEDDDTSHVQALVDSIRPYL